VTVIAVTEISKELQVTQPWLAGLNAFSAISSILLNLLKHSWNTHQN
jgi:hypothetical protein